MAVFCRKELHPPISLINMMMNELIHLQKGKISAEQFNFMDKTIKWAS